MINSPSLEDMREGKEILANEIGVVFRKSDEQEARAEAVDGADPSLVSCEGTVEGGVYRHKAAHFEWLIDVGSRFGLSPTPAGAPAE